LLLCCWVLLLLSLAVLQGKNKPVELPLPGATTRSPAGVASY
jgi:hypothetical protein